MNWKICLQSHNLSSYHTLIQTNYHVFSTKLFAETVSNRLHCGEQLSSFVPARWGCWFANWLDLESEAHGCSAGCSPLRSFSGTDPFSLVNTTKSPRLIIKPKDGRVSTPLAIDLGETTSSKAGIWPLRSSQCWGRGVKQKLNFP